MIKQGLVLTVLLPKSQADVRKAELRLPAGQKLGPEAAFNALMITVKGMSREDWDRLKEFLEGVASRAKESLRKQQVFPHHADVCQTVAKAVASGLQSRHSVTVDLMDNANPHVRYFAEYEPDVAEPVGAWAPGQFPEIVHQ